MSRESGQVHCSRTTKARSCVSGRCTARGLQRHVPACHAGRSGALLEDYKGTFLRVTPVDRVKSPCKTKTKSATRCLTIYVYFFSTAYSVKNRSHTYLLIQVNTPFKHRRFPRASSELEQTERTPATLNTTGGRTVLRLPPAWQVCPNRTRVLAHIAARQHAPARRCCVLPPTDATPRASGLTSQAAATPRHTPTWRPASTCSF